MSAVSLQHCRDIVRGVLLGMGSGGVFLVLGQFFRLLKPELNCLWCISFLISRSDLALGFELCVGLWYYVQLGCVCGSVPGFLVCFD